MAVSAIAASMRATGVLSARLKGVVGTDHELGVPEERKQVVQGGGVEDEGVIEQAGGPGRLGRKG